MAESYREKALIKEQKNIAEGVFSMWLETKQIAKGAVPGQFISVYSKDGARLLPRPISICEIKDDQIRIVYRTVGKGTTEFSGYGAGEELDIQGPLGNGYTLSDKKAIIFGGGIGIPPMLELSKQLNCEKEIVLGYGMSCS